MVLENNATMVLEEGNATVVLDSAASEMQTALLSVPATASAAETTMLSQQMPAQAYAAPVQNPVAFGVEIEITYIHTNVTIPQEG